MREMRYKEVGILLPKKSLRNVRNNLEVLPVAQWSRHCVTSWKVAGSIPDGFIEIFH
jgi:hypothetical protein